MYRVVQILVFVLVIASYYLSTVIFKDNGYFLHEICTHIFTELLVLFFATFFVEKIIEQYNEKKIEKKWQKTKTLATSELILSISYLMATISIFLGTFKKAENLNPKTVTFIKFRIFIAENSSNTNQSDIQKLLKDLPVEIKKDFLSEFGTIKDNFQGSILLYKDVLPPNIFEQCIELRKFANMFYFSFYKHVDHLSRNTKPNIIEGDYSIMEDQIKVLSDTALILAALLD